MKEKQKSSWKNQHMKTSVSLQSVNIFNNNAFLTFNISGATLIFQFGF